MVLCFPDRTSLTKRRAWNDNFRFLSLRATLELLQLCSDLSQKGVPGVKIRLEIVQTVSQTMETEQVFFLYPAEPPAAHALESGHTQTYYH
jgi:hypothetical protein